MLIIYQSPCLTDNTIIVLYLGKHVYGTCNTIHYEVQDIFIIITLGIVIVITSSVVFVRTLPTYYLMAHNT